MIVSLIKILFIIKFHLSSNNLYEKDKIKRMHYKFISMFNLNNFLFINIVFFIKIYKDRMTF